jgi:hypothetical protein
MHQIAAQAKQEEFHDAWILPPLRNDEVVSLQKRDVGNIRGSLTHVTANFPELHASPKLDQACDSKT